MIAFISIFLGLITGVKPVELAVSGTVAEVEIRLDGELVGRLRGEPWTLDCDFGDQLATHELVAIARGPRGLELDRAVQLINIPRPQVDAQILLDEWRAGSPRSARLIWRAVEPAEPAAVSLSLDGEAIADRYAERYQLPELDPESLHFLSAQLEFPDNVVSSAEVVFGGVFGDSTATELTAIPLLVDRRRPLRPSRLQGRLEADREALRVVAVDKGPAEVVFVRDHRTITDLATLYLKFRSRRDEYDQLGLAKRDAVLVMSPRASFAVHPDTRYAVFPLSPPMTRRQASLIGMLAGVRFERDRPTLPQRLTDAVATAGLRAAASQKRRAVVLVTSDCGDASGQWSPEVVRRYLSQMRVTFRVWLTEKPTKRELASDSGFCDGAEPIHDLRRYHTALHRLRGDLGRQQIAWVEGRHLQRKITLSDADENLRLAE